MFCSFDQDPKILRLYGQAQCIHPDDSAWDEHIGRFPLLPGARQILVMEVDLVQTSCGFGVPLFDYRGERETLRNWAEKKGEAGIKAYWEERNALSLDGKPTGL
jgi:hypothetical protein